MNDHDFVGYVYLVQSSECLKADRFKIGMSENPNMLRIQKYGPERQEHIIKFCDNPFEVEQVLIQTFTKCFTVAKGKEYFYGDITKAIELFNHDYVIHAICDSECFSDEKVDKASCAYRAKLREVWQSDPYYDLTRTEKFRLCRDVLMSYLQLKPSLIRLFYHLDQDDLNAKTINASIEFVQLGIRSEREADKAVEGFSNTNGLRKTFLTHLIDHDMTKMRNFVAKYHSVQLTEWCSQYLEDDSIDILPRRFSENEVSRPAKRINSREMFFISSKSFYKILISSRCSRLTKRIAQFLYEDINTIYKDERIAMLIERMKMQDELLTANL